MHCRSHKLLQMKRLPAFIRPSRRTPFCWLSKDNPFGNCSDDVGMGWNRRAAQKTSSSDWCQQHLVLRAAASGACEVDAPWSLRPLQEFNLDGLAILVRRSCGSQQLVGRADAAAALLHDVPVICWVSCQFSSAFACDETEKRLY